MKKRILLLLSLTFTLFGCNKGKDKGKEVTFEILKAKIEEVQKVEVEPLRKCKYSENFTKKYKNLDFHDSSLVKTTYEYSDNGYRFNN